MKKTVFIETTGFETIKSDYNEGKTPVLASAHTTLLPAILSYKLKRVTTLVSRSKDGELIANVMKKNGYQTVRGSSNRGGQESLVELVKAVKANEPIALAFDGPKGPPLVAKYGVAVCAEAASGSLYFLRIHPVDNFLFRRPFAIRLKSWDRFLLLFPFCRVRVDYEKIEVDVPKGDPLWRQKVVAALEEKARDAYGYLYKK